MEQNSVHLDLCKKPLQWKPKSERNHLVNQATDDDGEFGDLLYELRTDMKILKEDECRIRKEIGKTVVDLEAKMGEGDFLRIFGQSMARFNTELELSEREVSQLASSLKVICGLADNISGRVSALDTARSRVVECLQRVSDLRDLHTCAEGVQTAMAQEEYDEAARHVHRFFALDSAVFKMGEQFDVEDKQQSLKQCYETLRAAAAELKITVERKFDEARVANDVASMERFFKLFPLINEHNSGLRRFADYLCTKIATLGNDNFKILQAGGTEDKRANVIYADALRLFFESIARLIELHQPLIDNFYGVDKLLVLFELIQPECDKQSLRVVNEFMQKRQIEHKARLVDAYMRNGISEEKIDALELDVLLSETTLMHTHAELYWRFLKRRAGEAPFRPYSESSNGAGCGEGVPISNSGGGGTSGKSPPLSPTLKNIPEVVFFEGADPGTDDAGRARQAAQAHAAEIKKRRNERDQKLDTLLHRTALNMKMQEILGKYVLMEQYYMIESVKKAIEMDDVEEGSLTSTILDDVFFIVRKSIRRSISSASVDCVCAVLNNGVTLLETEFIKHVNAPIQAGYPSAGWTSEAYQTAAQTAQTAYQQVIQPTAAKIVGGGTGTGTAGLATTMEKSSANTTERQRSSFIIALNNLRAAVECVNALRTGLDADFKHHLAQISDLEKGKLENSIGQLDDLCKKLEYYLNFGVAKLCEAAFRSKLKNDAEEYLDISHSLTDDELADYEAVDPFIEKFISLINRYIVAFESVLLPENYQALCLEASVEALRQFERCVCKCAFNRQGALYLDKESRQLTAALTSLAGWAIREKCTRISQIVALLNSESFDEAVEFLQHTTGQTDGLAAVSLTLREVRKILALRTDFPTDKIKQLRL